MCFFSPIVISLTRAYFTTCDNNLQFVLLADNVFHHSFKSQSIYHFSEIVNFYLVHENSSLNTWMMH